MKLQKKCCSHVGLARRNLENLERDKTVKIMQGFSFKIEEAKMMVAILVPDVKSANGVNTFQVFTSEKTILNWEVLQKPRMCTGTRTAVGKKMSGVMRGSADSLILQKSNARTMKMRKSDLWLAFCAHQIS